jgi:hypothetical protein
MKDIRFYEEFCDKSKHTSMGTVVAVLLDVPCYLNNGHACYEAVVGVFNRPNSPVCCGGVALDYLREQCKRISEAEARAIHPALFAVLDTPDEVA